MSWRWLNPFVSNLWAWLSAGLVFWGAANAVAFFRFTSLIAPYRTVSSSPSTGKMVEEFGKAVAATSGISGGLMPMGGSIRSPASVGEASASDTHGPLIRAYLQNADNEARAEEFRRLVGSPPAQKGA